jgi:hypothetical protein
MIFIRIAPIWVKNDPSARRSPDSCTEVSTPFYHNDPVQLSGCNSTGTEFRNLGLWITRPITNW